MMKVNINDHLFFGMDREQEELFIMLYISIHSVLNILNMFSIWYLFKWVSFYLPAIKSKPKPQVGKVKGNIGKGMANNVNPIPAAPYNFIEEQEETISQYSSNIKPHGRNAKNSSLKIQTMTILWRTRPFRMFIINLIVPNIAIFN